MCSKNLNINCVEVSFTLLQDGKDGEEVETETGKVVAPFLSSAPDTSEFFIILETIIIIHWFCIVNMYSTTHADACTLA